MNTHTYHANIYLGSERGAYHLQVTKQQAEALKRMSREDKIALVDHVMKSVEDWFAKAEAK